MIDYSTNRTTYNNHKCIERMKSTLANASMLARMQQLQSVPSQKRMYTSTNASSSSSSSSSSSTSVQFLVFSMILLLSSSVISMSHAFQPNHNLPSIIQRPHKNTFSTFATNFVRRQEQGINYYIHHHNNNDNNIGRNHPLVILRSTTSPVEKESSSSSSPSKSRQRWRNISRRIIGKSNTNNNNGKVNTSTTPIHSQKTIEQNSSTSNSIARPSESTDVNSKQMKFIGKKQVQVESTKPISIPILQQQLNNNNNNIQPTVVLQQKLNEFFTNENNRNLLFPTNNAITLYDFQGRNNNDYHMNDNTRIKEWMEIWKRESKLGGGEEPILFHNSNNNSNSNSNLENNIQQSIFQIDAVLQMPGLKIISESTIGMKLLLGSTSTSLSSSSSSSTDMTRRYPEYQFTLLESNLKPIGPKPLVWLFHKLTKYRDSTSSFTKVQVQVEPTTNTNTCSTGMNTESSTPTSSSTSLFNQITFITNARLETRMHLPSTLLRVLPKNVNIENFERQGSEAIQKLLEKELEPALVGFCDAFCEFCERKE